MLYTFTFFIQIQHLTSSPCIDVIPSTVKDFKIQKLLVTVAKTDEFKDDGKMTDQLTDYVSYSVFSLAVTFMFCLLCTEKEHQKRAGETGDHQEQGAA